MMPRTHGADAVMPAEAALVRGFEEVWATRMAGLPVVNEALAVEAVGFRDWQDARVGVLVTPWSLLLVVLGTATAQLGVLPSGSSETRRFPAGEFEFYGHELASGTPYRQCSLMSPVDEFDSHADAVVAARAAVDALFTVAEPARMSRRSLLMGA